MAMVAEISLKNGEITVHKVTTVADLGRMVNPDTVEAQIQSSIVFGLTAALYGDINLEKGRVQQTNFHQYKLLRMNESPEMVTVLVPSTEKPGGVGEPGTALIGPAVGNAVFAATGKRLRSMPFTPEKIQSA
jgi:isoquinoline 1-oxidoreductase subunit beta